MEFVALVLAIACLALLVVEEVVLADSECDKTYITIGDAVYHLDCDGYIPAEGAEVSYHANGERIFDIAPADDEG